MIAALPSPAARNMLRRVQDDCDALDRSEKEAAGFLFVNTGLAYDAFGTPRPDAYFQATDTKAPVVSQRYEGKAQLDVRLK
jgi:hypothetical protein